jgi:hypothetical protein
VKALKASVNLHGTTLLTIKFTGALNVSRKCGFNVAGENPSFFPFSCFVAISNVEA